MVTVWTVPSVLIAIAVVVLLKSLSFLAHTSLESGQDAKAVKNEGVRMLEIDGLAAASMSNNAL